MQVWRICKQKHLAGAFSGEGGLYTGARWTPQGIKAVYTIPVEYNYILNPTHPDFEISLNPPIEFKFDRRMWKPELGSDKKSKS